MIKVENYLSIIYNVNNLLQIIYQILIYANCKTQQLWIIPNSSTRSPSWDITWLWWAHVTKQCPHTTPPAASQWGAMRHILWGVSLCSDWSLPHRRGDALRHAKIASIASASSPQTSLQNMLQQRDGNWPLQFGHILSMNAIMRSSWE